MQTDERICLVQRDRHEEQRAHPAPRSRSRSACTKLIADGLDNVVNVEGGTSAWKSAGLPVEPANAGGAKPAWIRPAGLLLVFGCLALGIAVNQFFAIAAAVVWIGLVVTGNSPCCCGTSSCSVPKGQ